MSLIDLTTMPGQPTAEAAAESSGVPGAGCSGGICQTGASSGSPDMTLSAVEGESSRG